MAAICASVTKLPAVPPAASSRPDYGELLITQQLACGRDLNSRIARRSHVDSLVGTQSSRIAGRVFHAVRHAHAVGCSR